jgi:heme-degrading monooxygenase HmoA
MILRTWHGRTSLADADDYEGFMRHRAAPDYKSVPGLIRAIFTRRDDELAAHFLLITIWQDLESVKRFAGSDPERAKYYEEDERYLLEKEEFSHNHVVFYDSLADEATCAPPATECS